MSYYSTAEKVMLILVGGLISPILSVLILRFSRRRLAEKQSTRSRAFLFYSALAGVLLGQYVCHTIVIPDRFDARIMSLCSLAGFVVMYLLTAEARMWNSNYNIVAPPDDDIGVNEDAALDKRSMEEHRVLVSDDIGGESFSTTQFAAEDLSKDIRKRVWMMWTLFFVLGVVLAMDGLLLVYHSTPAAGGGGVAAVICFMLNGIALSVAIYGSMIHAKYHVMEEFYYAGFVRWVFLTALWCIMIVLSTLPVLMDITVATVTSVVEHIAFVIFYGLASGFVLGLCFYYLGRGRERSHRATIRLGMLVFALAAGQSGVTALWL